jgi:GTP-binding protein
MPPPQVAIVGRPNVGKSSVFNWLAGRRIAIVEPTAGVTRDRLSTPIDARERRFELIDTGGMGIQDRDNLTGDVEKQITVAINEADLILFVVDARDGIMPLDQLVAERLRKLDKPVLFVVNKCDVPNLDAAAQEFYQLGWKQLICVSAHQGRGKAELLDAIGEMLPADREAVSDQKAPLKLAIVGRRNTGKSTFINSLAQVERVIVSEVPGTTRDSVDVRFERDGKSFIAIDTAGVRKKGSIANSIEFYSLARAERSIRRADVVLLFLDPTNPVAVLDKQLADYIVTEHKPAIFVVNKWDLMRPMPTGEWGDYIKATFPSLDFVPIAFITAKHGKNVFKVLNLAQNLHKQASQRVSTSQVNRVILDAVANNSPPVRLNRQPRIYYATQVGSNPPTVVVFTNGPDLFDEPYLRYLLKCLRERLPYAEVPIRLQMRLRGRAGQLRARGMDEAESEPVASQRSAAVSRKLPSRRTRTKPDVWRDV